MKKNIILSIFIVLLFSSFSFAATSVRLKDISSILGARDNQIVGFGLVVGLKNKGDTQASSFTKQAMTNLLSKMGEQRYQTLLNIEIHLSQILPV